MRFAFRAASLAAAIALAGAAPDDPLAAIAAASGHAALVHVRATSSRTIEGRTIVTTFDQAGTARLLERCVGGACGGTWFDGDRRWTFGINGVVLPEADDDATRLERTLAAIASYAFAEEPFRRAGGTAVRVAADRWRVRARDGIELVAVLDPATHAVRRVETPGGAPVAAYGRDVRAGSALFALDRAGVAETGPLDGASAVAGPLSAPAGPLAEGAGDPVVRLGPEPVPVVPCSVGGRAARCLLDTGATPSAMTLSTSEALGLEPRGEIEMAGVGRLATGFVEAGPLVAGGVRIPRARFAVIPASRGIAFDVVVGADLLARMRLGLDRPHGIARIAPAGPASPGGAAGTVAAVTFRGGAPTVAATIGGVEQRALFDTGDEAVVSFGIREYRTGPQWPVVGRGEATGLAGTDDTLSVDVPSLTVGGLAAGPVRAVVRRTQAVPHLGVGLWTRYRIDLDEAGGRIVFSSP